MLYGWQACEASRFTAIAYFGLSIPLAFPLLIFKRQSRQLCEIINWQTLEKVQERICEANIVVQPAVFVNASLVTR